MIPIFNLQGFSHDDPLDRLSFPMRLALASLTTAAVTALFLYIEINVLQVTTLYYSWLFWFGCAAFAATLAPLMVVAPKSSSLLYCGIVLVIGFLLDMFQQAYYRDRGLLAWWTYNSGTPLYRLIPPIRFLVAWFIDGLIIGPAALWFSRLAAKAFWPAPTVAQPTIEQQQELFSKEWTHALKEERPVGWAFHRSRGIDFYLLRVLGLLFFGYLLLLLLGLLGASPWPRFLRDLLTMTYANPALALNTYGKISLMTCLATIAAYNRDVRWHATLALFVGHLVSMGIGLVLYIASPSGTPYRDFLLTSSVVDSLPTLYFASILWRWRRSAARFAPQHGFPDFLSLPDSLMNWLFRLFAGGALLWAIVILGLRLTTSGMVGIGALFGYPDPQISNTITLFSTLSVLSWLMISRKKLRNYFVDLLLLIGAILLIGSCVWLLSDRGNGITIATRSSGALTANWYFVLQAIIAAIGMAILGVLRKLYYRIDFVVTTISPNNARCVLALHAALFVTGNQESAAVLRRIDQHMADMRGRARGLLNFPFGFVEHVFSLFYGLRPPFSLMERDEQRYFLQAFLLRPPIQRVQALVPELADIAYKIGVVVHAFVTFAHYSHLYGWEDAGYIPPDARDRLQGDYPSAPPPFATVAQMPDGPEHPANNKPIDPPTPAPLIAPRVVTPICEPRIPAEVDYLIVGSGAGGACLAYRLAKAAPQMQTLVIERGARYAPLQDFNDDEMEMTRKLYKESGLQQSRRYDLTILQGECLGGSPVINNAICLRMPNTVRADWRDQYALELAGLDTEYDRIQQELEIAPIPEQAINRCVRERFLQGVHGYNNGGRGPALDAKLLNANQRNAVGDELWNVGNRRLRKRSPLETYIPWGETRGVRFVSWTSAIRVIPDRSGRKVHEVLLQTSTGDLQHVRVRRGVIVAGGVIASSNFLMRSGLQGNVGRGMSCNFALPVAFRFNERIDAFDGTQITLGATDTEYRAIFETYFNPPGSFALSLPFYFDRHRELMQSYGSLVNFGALVGSQPQGIIQQRPNVLSGRSFTWELDELDRRNLKYAIDTLLEIGLAAGATSAILPTAPGIELALSRKEIDTFKQRLDAYPLGMRDLHLLTAHPQGGNRMIGEKSRHYQARVVDERFRVVGYDNLFVADASLFPTSIRVNPQWTVMALSSLASKQVLELTL